MSKADELHNVLLGLREKQLATIAAGVLGESDREIVSMALQMAADQWKGELSFVKQNIERKPDESLLRQLYSAQHELEERCNGAQALLESFEE